MTIQYLAPNQAWCVMFGAGQIVDIEGRRLWASKSDLVAALGRVGLAVRGRRIVMAESSAVASEGGAQ